MITEWWKLSLFFFSWIFLKSLLYSKRCGCRFKLFEIMYIFMFLPNHVLPFSPFYLFANAFLPLLLFPWVSCIQHFYVPGIDLFGAEFYIRKYRMPFLSVSRVVKLCGLCSLLGIGSSYRIVFYGNLLALFVSVNTGSHWPTC